jgi:hypothetical protein
MDRHFRHTYGRPHSPAPATAPRVRSAPHEEGAPSGRAESHGRRPPGCGVSIHTRDVIMLVISLLTAVCSVCLYVLAVLYRAWAACWYSGLTLLVFGIFAVVLLARVIQEAA